MDALGAGLSLGEYTALHLAGAFSFHDGMRLVATRGRLMQEAAEASDGSMVALTGADEDAAESLCADARGDDVLVCANFNAPGQIVLSGSKSACQRAVIPAERSCRSPSSASSFSNRSAEALSSSRRSASASICICRICRSSASSSSGLLSTAMRSREAASSIRSIALSGK